ncbi:MAG: T9SS type A sorting domain-containing protein [Bacteroidota bacterium]
MKKLLLLTLALGIGFSSMAQLNKTTAFKKETDKLKSTAVSDNYSINQGPIKPMNTTTVGSKALNKTAFASSANVYTLLVSNSSCLSADPSLNAAMFISRGGGTYGWTGDAVIANFTTDKGATFTDYQMKTTSDATHSNRYPSGVIFKPAGATAITDCYAAYCGHSHNAGTWSWDHFGSTKLDSTFLTSQYFPLDSPARHEFTRIQYTACSDGKVHVMGDGGQLLAWPFTNHAVWNGTFNAANHNFDWTMDALPLHLKETAADGDLIVNWDMAWSDDGAIGYAIAYGVDSLTNLSGGNDDVIPLVMKTTDHGATWTAQAPFDFYTSTPTPDLKNKLDDWWTYVGHTGRPRVFFSSGSGSDVLVDANGNLHIATMIQCGFSKHQDSLLYTFMYEDRVIWDVFTTPTGWDAKVIDTILTLDVDVANGIPSSTGNVGWDHRLQISKNQTADRLFFTWTDSDTSFFDRVMAPDIFMRGRDVNTGIITPEYSQTRGTAYDGANYWMYVSSQVFDDGTNYEIPITTTTHGASADDPCTHYYFGGVQIPHTAFVGINENNGVISSISQNYPNPFSATTTINVNLAKATTLSVDVTNIMGQKVMTINKGNVGSGSHNVVIDGSKLTSGVYFYTVRAGENSVTRKMIVE